MPGFLSSDKNKFFAKTGLVVFVFLLLLVLPGSRNSVDESFEQLYSISAGQLQPDTNIVIINISSVDIERIGPWPIKRSYYALLINSLDEYNVKAIGLEVFLSSRLVTQAVYDNLLTREIERAGNVVLSSVAGEVKLDGNKFTTDSLSYPTPKLIDENLSSGHVNFIDDDGVNIPLEVKGIHSKEKAFSLVLSGLKMNFPPEEQVVLNIFAPWKKFKNYSLLEYFNLVQEKDSSLLALKDKIILIGISDPHVAPLFESYFEKDVPGVALHAFAVDNLLNFRSYRGGVLLTSKFVMLFFVLFILILHHRIKWGSFFFYVISFTIFVFTTFILFKFFHLQLSYSSFILPLLALMIGNATLYFMEKRMQLKGALDESIILKNLLSQKENELRKLEKELNVNPGSTPVSLIDKIKSLKNEIEKIRKDENDSEPVKDIYVNESKEFEGIIYTSKVMDSIVGLIRKASPEDANILILGESGTGKELVAKAIHSLSKRSRENFIAVNCGALSDNLLESELFGHIKGAFTGAIADKMGRFQSADKGTIFLDEIAETSENFQVKLLRIIQTGDFEKVGSSKTEHADVRIVAATNINIEDAVKEKKFREDLYYRLNVIKIELPPLRNRKEDIAAIANHFLSRENSELKISSAAFDALQNYDWKGNIRELEAVIKRAAIFARSASRKLIQLADLPQEIVKESKYSFDDLVMESMRNKKFSHSSIIETAKDLGNVSRTLVSENFRGILLRAYVENNFDEEAAAKKASASGEEQVYGKVKAKLQTYLKNIETDIKESGLKDSEKIKIKFASKYKNLPQKFHFYLDEIIRRIVNKP